MVKRFLLFLLLINTLAVTHSQNLPIGGWAALLPYRYAMNVVQGNGRIYCITSIDIFSVTTSENSIQEFNKVTGLSGINITAAAYNSALGVLVIGYQNSNIDLLYDNGSVTNVPAIEQATITGPRAVNSIYFIGTNAYVCCGFGIINLNLNTQLINDPPYYIGPGGKSTNVSSISVLSDTIYAATDDGVCYSTLNDSLFVPTNWHYFTSGIPSIPTKFIQSFNNRMYAVQNSSSPQSSSIYKYSNNKWLPVPTYSGTNWTVNGVTASSSNLVIAEDSLSVNAIKINLLNTSGVFTAIKPPGVGLPKEALEDNSGNLWIADNYNGLIKYQISTATSQNLTPNGPFTAGANGIAASNGNVFVASDLPAFSFSTDGFFVRNGNSSWMNFNINYPSQTIQQQMANVYNVTNVVAGPNNNTAYFGTFSDGMVYYNNGALTIYNNASNSSLQPAFGTSVAVSGMALDNENNLWLSNYGATNPISVFTPGTTATNGTWKSFYTQLGSPNNFFAQVTVDQFDQKWIINGSNGLIVLNTGTNLSSENDPQFKLLGTGVGNGNLPSPDVTSLAVDQSGNVWVGTNEGITVFYCPGNVFTTGCDAQQPIYSTSAGNGYLLGTDNIYAIVVDGANRKWVGTNSGVYLLSADGSEEVENFTAQNSPLFSNNVLSLALDPLTGILYIGTDQGMEEYRTTATEGSQTNCTVTVFPDPVRPNYTGPITITGIVADATVKITDVTGGLVYETTALGGQAIWNGNLQNGERAKSGVYLVFASSSDGTVHCMGKFLMIN